MKHIISKLCKNIEEKANIIRKEGQVSIIEHTDLFFNQKRFT